MEGTKFKSRCYIIFIKHKIILNKHDNKDTQENSLAVSMELHKEQQS